MSPVFSKHPMLPSNFPPNDEVKLSVIEEAAAIVVAIRKECTGMGTGRMPNPLELREYHSKLIDIHMKLTELTAGHYSSALVTKLKRMKFMGTKYKTMRFGGSMTAKDAEMHSRLEAGDEYDKEIQAEAVYEQHKLLLRSCEQAMQFCQGILSDIKSHERSGT